MKFYTAPFEDFKNLPTLNKCKGRCCRFPVFVDVSVLCNILGSCEHHPKIYSSLWLQLCWCDVRASAANQEVTRVSPLCLDFLLWSRECREDL